MAGLPTWCICIGILEGARAVAGIVHLPAFDEMYSRGRRGRPPEWGSRCRSWVGPRGRATVSSSRTPGRMSATICATPARYDPSARPRITSRSSPGGGGGGDSRPRPPLGPRRPGCRPRRRRRSLRVPRRQGRRPRTNPQTVAARPTTCWPERRVRSPPSGPCSRPARSVAPDLSLSSPRMELRGRWALVTGAAKRVGRAIALELAARGANVIIHYHTSAEPRSTTVGELESLGVRAVALPADLRRTSEVTRSPAKPKSARVASASSSTALRTTSGCPSTS